MTARRPGRRTYVSACVRKRGQLPPGTAATAWRPIAAPPTKPFHLRFRPLRSGALRPRRRSIKMPRLSSPAARQQSCCFVTAALTPAPLRSVCRGDRLFRPTGACLPASLLARGRRADATSTSSSHPDSRHLSNHCAPPPKTTTTVRRRRRETRLFLRPATNSAFFFFFSKSASHCASADDQSARSALGKQAFEEVARRQVDWTGRESQLKDRALAMCVSPVLPIIRRRLFVILPRGAREGRCRRTLALALVLASPASEWRK